MVVNAVNRQRFELAIKVTAVAAAGLFLNSCCCPEPPRPTFYDPHQNPRDPLFSGDNPHRGHRTPNDNNRGQNAKGQSNTDGQSNAYGGGGEPGGQTSPTQVQPTGGASINSVCGQNPLFVTGIIQEGFYSCWSTSAQMIIQYLGVRTISPPYQCEQSNLRFMISGCCTSGNYLDTTSATCDAASYPDFSQWLYSSTSSWPVTPGVPLTWSEITTEIDNCRPFCFSWQYVPPTPGLGSMKHMMVVIGYDTPTLMLKVLDPRWSNTPAAYWIPYTDYSGSSGAYIHDTDFYNIH